MIALRKLDGRGQGPPRRQRHLGCSVGKLSYYKLEHQELERSEAPPRVAPGLTVDVITRRI